MLLHVTTAHLCVCVCVREREKRDIVCVRRFAFVSVVVVCVKV